MSRWCHFHLIVLMLLMTMKTVETQVIGALFDMVEPGQSIMGKLGAEQPARKHLECSSMCLLDDSCQGYQYKNQGIALGQCVLIYNGCRESFQNNGSAVTYKKASSKQSDVNWIPLSNWTGPSAALYQSFDSSDVFMIMERNQASEVNSVSLVPGKVNKALVMNLTRNQSIDLGIHTKACMTRPETCSAAGGAISVWVNVINCPGRGGIISSYGPSTGSVIYCYYHVTGFAVYQPNGKFVEIHPEQTGWTHIVLNYIGSNGDEGIRIYYDGAEMDSDTIKTVWPYSAGNGTIVVERYYTAIDGDYTGVEVDELIYFNAGLTSDDVQSIYNSA